MPRARIVWVGVFENDVEMNCVVWYSNHTRKIWTEKIPRSVKEFIKNAGHSGIDKDGWHYYCK